MPSSSTRFTRQCSTALHILQLCLPILLLIGVFAILFWFTRRNRSFTYEPFDATVLTDQPTQPTQPALPTHTRVYWTGGFDSTFRVLQALMDDHQTVTPYYLSGDIDNAAARKTRRRNHKMEQRAMDTVQEMLARDFPEAAARLRPTVVVDEVALTPTTRQRMRRLAEQKVVRRPTCQYGSLGQYALQLGQPIEIGIVRDGHSNAGIYAGVQDKVAGVGASCRLTDTAMQAHPEYALFQNCVFPLLHLQKPDMLRIAKEGGYAHMLQHTWSCWYPTPDNRPCNKCLMCRERVLSAQGGQGGRGGQGGQGGPIETGGHTEPGRLGDGGVGNGIPFPEQLTAHRHVLDEAVHHPSDVPEGGSSGSGVWGVRGSAQGSEVVLGRAGGGGAGGGFYSGGEFGAADRVALGY